MNVHNKTSNVYKCIRIWAYDDNFLSELSLWVIWYNENTQVLKKAARKMESSWKKINIEVFRIVWKDNDTAYKKALKTRYALRLP